ncbi:hypothetical protein D039_1716A, partial [Vibrio parahaemolyticus EKP-028]
MLSDYVLPKDLK